MSKLVIKATVEIELEEDIVKAIQEDKIEFRLLNDSINIQVGDNFIEGIPINWKIDNQTKDKEFNKIDDLVYELEATPVNNEALRYCHKSFKEKYNCNLKSDGMVPLTWIRVLSEISDILASLQVGETTIEVSYPRRYIHIKIHNPTSQLLKDIQTEIFNNIDIQC